MTILGYHTAESFLSTPSAHRRLLPEIRGHLHLFPLRYKFSCRWLRFLLIFHQVLLWDLIVSPILLLVLLYQLLSQSIRLQNLIFPFFLPFVQLLNHLLVIKGKFVFFFLSAVHVLRHFGRAKHCFPLITSINALFSQVTKFILKFTWVHFYIAFQTPSEDFLIILLLSRPLTMSLIAHSAYHETFGLASIRW